MKTFTLSILMALLCSAANAQIFYVQNSDSKIKSNVESWIHSKGFLTGINGVDSIYTVLCEFVEKKQSGKGDIIFTVYQNKTKNVAGVAVGDFYRRNTPNDFLEVAEDKLETILKKVKISEGLKSNKVIFNETEVTIKREKLDLIKVINIRFGGQKETPYEVKIKKVDTSEDVTFNNARGQDIYHINAKGGETYPLELLVKADTTIKDGREHLFLLTYREKNQTNYKGSEYLKIKVDVISPKKNTAVAFKPIDFLLFIGTTLDPNATSNKIKGFSFEGIIPIQITKTIWTRIGGYLHPNFSRDSSTRRIGEYYKLDNNPLVSGVSDIGRSTGTADVNYDYESIGLFADIFFPLNSIANQQIKEGVRFSPFLHIEWAQRNVTPRVQSSNVVIDTVKFVAETIDPKFVNREKLNMGYIYPKKTLSQFYWTVGVMVEASFSDINMFFQPYFGARREFESTVVSSRRSSTGSWSFGFKMAAKLFNSFNISADVKDLYSNFTYVNISFGIPISLTDALKKKE